MKNLDLPLGWKLSTGDEPPQPPNDVVGWIAKLLGLALTIGAMMLGAPSGSTCSARWCAFAGPALRLLPAT